MTSTQADIDDVCSDVFMVAWRRFSEVCEAPDPAARRWLLRVAELRCLTVWRSHLRRDRAYERVAFDLEDTGDLCEVMAVEEYDRRVDAVTQVETVLQSLGPSHVEVLRLDMEGQFSGLQMAQLLGVSHLAFRLRLMRAKRAFRAEHQRLFGWPDRRSEGDDL